MTECIDIISNGRTNPKTLQKVALPVKELALPPDGGWQVRVGLNHLSASNMPLTSFDQATNARKKIRVQAFDQAIEPCLSPCIEKVRVLITAVSGGTKGGQRHSQTGSRWALPIMYGQHQTDLHRRVTYSSSSVCGHARMGFKPAGCFRYMTPMRAKERTLSLSTTSICRAGAGSP